MNNCLYFICPTDFLEPVINNYHLTDVNYYYTSLGNSVLFNEATIKIIAKLITLKQIDTINFVLSTDNSIVLDALKDQQYQNISGLHSFYTKLLTNDSFQLEKEIMQVLTSHLIRQTNALQTLLTASVFNNLKIESKLYDKKTNKFHTIYNKYFLWRTRFSVN